ncbi:arginine decarboxylase, pyruvoyl-dependent [bacterium]|nr:arginine decarboxylase, pyruvoyl-dependent [bacterium]
MFHFTNIPTSFFFCSGSAEAVSPLNAFDAALLAAGIGNTNLVKISSIVPPGCEETTVPEVLQAGLFLPTAWKSFNSSNKGEEIAAAVAIAIPQDRSLAGVIMEEAGPGSARQKEQFVRTQVEVAMQIRAITLYDIRSISISHQVVSCGTVFAAVVLQP